MNEKFKTIAETLIREGFQNLTTTAGQPVRSLDFNMTPYSLNTPLSFKFNNLDDLLSFLHAHHGTSDLSAKASILQTKLVELGLDAKEFFYVNFFEKGKEGEM